jgi:hypothetical protein
MLSNAFEFLRIADTNPGDEKVRRRKEAASSLLKLLGENRDLMLSVLQGVVAGFNAAPLSQDSPAVQAVIDAVKERDTAFPNDLSENALELRSVAAIAIGELLTQGGSDQGSQGNAVLAALSLQSALAIRVLGTDKHLRAMFETLEDAAQKLAMAASLKRRERSSASLVALEDFVVSEEDGEAKESGSLGETLPLIKSAFKEARDNAVKDREELETLWWLFGIYSETQRTPLQKLSPAAAAFCSGVELADRSLLPPSLSTIAMIDRAVQANRKPAPKAITLEAAIEDWTKPMIDALLTPDASVKVDPDLYPALLPVAWACKQVRDHTQSPKLDKGFKTATGIDGKQEAAPSDWGAQIFREKIVLRALARKEK